MSVHASLHYGRGKWFVDVVHGADIEAMGFVFNFCLPGEKDYGNVSCFRVGFEPGTNFVSIHAGHHHVEQD